MLDPEDVPRCLCFHASKCTPEVHAESLTRSQHRRENSSLTIVQGDVMNEADCEKTITGADVAVVMYVPSVALLLDSGLSGCCVPPHAAWEAGVIRAARARRHKSLILLRLDFFPLGQIWPLPLSSAIESLTNSRLYSIAHSLGGPGNTCSEGQKRINAAVNKVNPDLRVVCVTSLGYVC